jgi:hypothetical protein
MRRRIVFFIILFLFIGLYVPLYRCVDGVKVGRKSCEEMGTCRTQYYYSALVLAVSGSDICPLHPPGMLMVAITLLFMACFAVALAFTLDYAYSRFRDK